MSEQQISEQEAVERIYAYAAQNMADGLSNRAIRDDLVEQGLDEQSADIVVRELNTAKKSAVRSMGMKHMGIGAAWCIGGIVVTVATYQAASGGGTYVVAWGAIAFGGLEFLYGLFKTLTG